jgi:hypothetical protein
MSKPTKKVLGVPRPKKVGSGSPSKSSARKPAGFPSDPSRKSQREELREAALEYMGWEDEKDMGELFTPTRRSMIAYLVDFAFSQPQQD